jgi:iron-sulfur cluster assembly protein
MITVTENAVKHLRDLLAARGASQGGALGLRLFVERGGCAGMQYAMEVAAPQPGDTPVTTGGVTVYVAADSADLLRGVRVDYSDSLSDSGFKVQNPNAARSCGCGTSFEPARPDQAAEYDPSMDGSVCGGPGARP